MRWRFVSLLRITTYIENRRFWGKKTMAIQGSIWTNRQASDVDGPSRPSAVPGKAVGRPSGPERSFRGHRVRTGGTLAGTAGRYVLQRNKRRRRRHCHLPGMTASGTVLGTGCVKLTLSQTSNGQKTSIAADERGIPSDRVSVGGLDTATAGELEPSLRREDLPGRKSATTVSWNRVYVHTICLAGSRLPRRELKQRSPGPFRRALPPMAPVRQYILPPDRNICRFENTLSEN